MLLDLDKFVSVIEGHAVDVVLGGVTDEGCSLARVGVDDARRGNGFGEVEYCSNLGLRSTVESESESGHESKDVRVGVGLDSCAEETDSCQFRKNSRKGEQH